MDFHFLFRISIVAFCFDCALIAAHLKGEALVNNGKKSSLQAVLEEMGYSMNDLKSMSKSAVVGLLGEVSTRYKTVERKLLILAVRSRIEELQYKRLWPRKVPKAKTRRECFKEILTSQKEEFLENENVCAFRTFFNQTKLSLNSFLDTLIELYGEFNDNAAHNVRLPYVVTRDDIREMFINLGLVPDDIKISCVEVIMKPIKLNLGSNDEQE